ncbi:hypothetical protein F2Q68_00039882 [Brassica cretica]|uniref:Uncharacterized protein n=1 Tax=Brassica cretica TaxID=69181 RepID=A0A8S9MHR2_BRACR|nr:hypothetical protein F2Q68_00039882 [Brassica cretica]
MNSTGGGREILLAVEKSSLGVVSSKLNASFLLDRCVTSGNRSSLLPCRTCESYQGASSGIRATQPVLSIHLLIYPSILHLFNNMSFKRQNDTIIVQEFISEFKQMIEAKFAPINKRIDQLETQQKRYVPSHEKPESRRLAAEDWFVDLETRLKVQVKCLFLVGPVRHIRQQIEFASLSDISGAGPSESMDSSGSSLDLTAEVENPSCTATSVALLSPEIDRVGFQRSSSFAGGEGVGGVRDLSRSAESPLLENFDSSIPSAPSRWWLPVQEIVKKERKRLPVFDGCWTEKFASMYLPGFSTVWCTADIPSVDPSLGERTTKQVLELPIERRQVPFLVSKEALERCIIWGNMSGSKGEEALAEYKRALEVMSAKKADPKRAAPSENDDEKVSPSSLSDPEKTSEAEYRGLPTPSFEGEPVIPSKTETEKSPEPTADDPPTDP